MDFILINQRSGTTRTVSSAGDVVVSAITSRLNRRQFMAFAALSPAMLGASCRLANISGSAAENTQIDRQNVGGIAQLDRESRRIGEIDQCSALTETDGGDERQRDAADDDRHQQFHQRDATTIQHGSAVRSTTVFVAVPVENVTLSLSARTPLAITTARQRS